MAAKSFALNLAIATVWLLFSSAPSVGVFTLGYLMGFAFLFLLQEVLASQDYIRRTLGLLRFLLVFLKEFLLANLSVLRIILGSPRESIPPNFLTLDVTGMTRLELLILTYCITLTPGTTSVEVEADFQTLVVHALDAKHPEHVRAQINTSLRDAILRFTR
jgi:multicomponent Na+:H+ antiporter subunit E